MLIHTSIPLKPEYREDAIQITREFAKKSKSEDDIVRYRAMMDINDQNTLRFFEQYEDAEAVEAHAQSEYYQEWIDNLPEMVDGQLQNIQFSLNESPETVSFDIEDVI